MKFNISYRVIKLGLAVNVKKLVIALGNFVLAKFNFEVISVSELFTKQPRKNFSNPVSVQDISSVIPNKGIFNNVGFSDGEKYFAEDYASEDYVSETQFTWLLYRSLSESPTVQDQIAFQYPKFFTEDIKVIDFLGGEVDKTDKTIDYFDVIGNTSLIADQFERQVDYVRSFSELTSIVDSAAISLSRGLANSAAASDNFTYEIFIGVPLADSSSASDSGSLRSQGYTEDMTYFAEDYVGESRTFT